MTKIFKVISIKQHIYAGKNSVGMVTENSLDIVINFEHQAHDIEACRGYFGTNMGRGMSRVSIKFGLDPSIANGKELTEAASYLADYGQSMVHEKTSAGGTPTRFDAREYVSTLSLIDYGKEYYVPLDNDLAKKIIKASGINVLIGMSNKEIIDKITV